MSNLNVMNLLKGFFILICLCSFGQRQQESWTNNLHIGDSTRVNIFQSGDRYKYDLMFFSLHENETSSVKALTAYAEHNEIRFFYLLHEELNKTNGGIEENEFDLSKNSYNAKKRLVKTLKNGGQCRKKIKKSEARFFYNPHQQTNRIIFTRKGEKYSFDPSKIFTKKGRVKTLKEGGTYDRKAQKEVYRFALSLMNRVAINQVAVELNNNSNGNYSVKSFLPNGEEAKRTKLIYVNEEMDADDFIYTTDSLFFKAFKARQINVVLESNETLEDDGSVAYYCSFRPERYINIEAQFGHVDKQIQLIEALMNIIAEEIKIRGYLKNDYVD